MECFKSILHYNVAVVQKAKYLSGRHFQVDQDIRFTRKLVLNCIWTTLLFVVVNNKCN
jgi:hypothetical protein